MFIRQLRLCTGLILAVYVAQHLLNHALGLLSLSAMDAYLGIAQHVWNNPIGGLVLYGSFLTHFLLGLWSLYQRRNLRLKWWEGAQIALGLLVLPLILGHMVATRLSHELFGTTATYEAVVTTLWGQTWLIIKQSLVLLIVWGHLVLGIHFWLRIKPWYPSAVPVLYPIALLLPLLALLGFYRAGLETEVLATVPGWLDRVFADYRALGAQARESLSQFESGALAMIAVLLGSVLMARLVRYHYRNRFGLFRVTHPCGQPISAPVGSTLLEALRGAGIPHASACGGRGRCTTCRVRVVKGDTDLAPPGETEMHALKRISAPPKVRLACQMRPRRDVTIAPLLAATASARDAREGDSIGGREEYVTVLFLDLRNSTALAEHLLPYDVVYILNQFLSEMVTALKVSGGYYSQFTGDGLMALYGLGATPEAGCRAAIHGAVEMLTRFDATNDWLHPDIGESLRIGIGIHSGEAIVGRMGPPEAPVLSAIGDTVNIAARVEALCKTYDCSLVISKATAQCAGIDLSEFPSHAASTRGRRAPITVYAVAEPQKIADQFAAALQRPATRSQVRGTA